MNANPIHQSHPEIVRRLRRAKGHLRSMIDMIETPRPCLEVAQQLHAVKRAIAQAKKTLIHDHIETLSNRSSALCRVTGAARSRNSRRSQSISEGCRRWAH